MSPTPQRRQAAIKTAVRLRDGMRCVRCGKTNADHFAAYGKSLHVHRLQPGTPYTVDGCITVCSSCHPTEAKRSPGEPDIECCRLGVPLHLYIKPALRQLLDELVSESDPKTNATAIVETALRRYFASIGRTPPPRP